MCLFSKLILAPISIFFEYFPSFLYSKILSFSFLDFLSLPNSLKNLQISEASISFQDPNCPYTIRSTMASSRAGSKWNGKAPMQEDSLPYYDHSRYPFREAFNHFSTRNNNFDRIPNFSYLDFMNFNQIMRRLKWQSFAKLNNPSY